MSQIRKKIHDAIIQGLTELKHEGTTVPLFGTVGKIFVDYPNTFPVAEVVPTGTVYKISDNMSDERIFKFQILVYDAIDQSKPSTELGHKIDRLQNIEDIIADFVLKIPNNLQAYIEDFEILTTNIEGVNYFYEEGETGARIYMLMDINVNTVTLSRT